MNSAMAWLGWVTLVVGLGLIGVLYVDPLSRRLPWVQVIETASTSRALRRAVIAYDRARARLSPPHRQIA
jgi:hypothetical protein